jgi:magnesium-transporting ATPase (P-type)
LPLTLSEVLDPRYKCTNIYFVIAGALQFIPSITLTGGVSTIWINVGILMVMDITMMGIQDYARSRADALTNKLPVERCGADTLATKGAYQPTGSGGTGSAAAFRSATWADVKVGDIVRVKDREAFPADCVFLRACDPEPGQCWVSTKPLDGESDTKLRLAVKQAAALMPDAEVATCLKALRGATFRAEPPNDKVNDFTGLLFLEGQEPVLVTPQNMLLRGTQLRSTRWVYALVVATGRGGWGGAASCLEDCVLRAGGGNSTTTTQAAAAASGGGAGGAGAARRPAAAAATLTSASSSSPADGAGGGGGGVLHFVLSDVLARASAAGDHQRRSRRAASSR